MYRHPDDPDRPGDLVRAPMQCADDHEAVPADWRERAESAPREYPHVSVAPFLTHRLAAEARATADAVRAHRASVRRWERTAQHFRARGMRGSLRRAERTLGAARSALATLQARLGGSRADVA